MTCAIMGNMQGAEGEEEDKAFLSEFEKTSGEGGRTVAPYKLWGDLVSHSGSR